MSKSPPDARRDHSSADGREESRLDRRRRRRDSARLALETAETAVKEVDGRLEANAQSEREQETALERARDDVLSLERAVKRGRKDREKLVKERKRARGALTKAAGRAESADARYDELILAELVHREARKDHERA